VDYDIFEQLCSKNNTTPTALTRKLGLSKGNTSSWKKGGNPSVEVLSKLADELNCTTDLLLGRSLNKNNSPTELTVDEQELLTYFKQLDTLNKGRILGKTELLAEIKKEPKNITKTVLKQPKAVELTETDQITEYTYTYIDLYDMPASAGNGTYLMSNSCEPLKVKCNSLTSDANFAVEVRGESMEPSFYDGDIILIKTQPFVELGELGIFIINDEGYVKKFGGDRLISLNSKYKDVSFHEYDDIHCKGKVLGVLNKDDILE